MRCVMSLTGMKGPVASAMPADLAGHEPPGAIVLTWGRGATTLRLIVTAEQLASLCNQVIEYVPVQEGPTDGAQPSAN